MKPQILSVRTAARSRLFHIESVQLKFANGCRREFERIAAGPRPGTALVVAMPDPATVLLVREYAVGLDRFELSLPMGRIEVGESSLDAANRELMEETGFRAAHLRPLHTLTLALDLTQRKDGLRLEMDDVAGSPAQARVVNGK